MGVHAFPSCSVAELVRELLSDLITDGDEILVNLGDALDGLTIRPAIKDS